MVLVPAVYREGHGTSLTRTGESHPGLPMELSATVIVGIWIVSYEEIDTPVPRFLVPTRNFSGLR